MLFGRRRWRWLFFIYHFNYVAYASNRDQHSVHSLDEAGATDTNEATWEMVIVPLPPIKQGLVLGCVASANVEKTEWTWKFAGFTEDNVVQDFLRLISFVPEL
jgi:hypothetical protein